MEIKTRLQLIELEKDDDVNAKWVKVDDVINDLKCVIDIEKELLKKWTKYFNELSQSNPSTVTPLGVTVGNDKLSNPDKKVDTKVTTSSSGNDTLKLFKDTHICPICGFFIVNGETIIKLKSGLEKHSYC